MTQNQKLRLLMLALGAGDSLGSTSEFCDQSDVPSIYNSNNAQGWPFRQVGHGPFNWAAGEPTDDSAMAMCMVRSFIAKKVFDPSDIAARWVEWMESHPPDIGNATRAGLEAIRRGMHWHEGGLGDFLRNSNSAANGSLMRNAPVIAMADTLGQAFEFSLKQSVVTHYGPLPVVCCCAQSFLLWRFLKNENPFATRWRDDFFECFFNWLSMAEDRLIRDWSDKTMTQQVRAWDTFLSADFDPQTFNPFGYKFDGKDGYCLLTLQIAVWAVQRSLSGKPLPTPPGFVGEAFVKAVGPFFGAIVPLIGHDSDTYAAVAFPLIAAAHGQVPDSMTAGLNVAAELDALGLLEST